MASEELNTVEEQSSSVVRIVDIKDLLTTTTVSAGMQEALATATCCTMINPTTILFPAETPRLNEELRKRGITPVEVPFKPHAYGAGGIRCKISVVRREI